MSQRIKGQEVEVLVVVNGVPQENTTDVRNFEFEFMTEILKEGYLGETTDRYDSIFRGIRGKFEFHFENNQIFQIIQSIVAKARRRLPGTRINIKATLQFPNGQRVRVIIPNVEFGALPINFGGRAEYGSLNTEFNASEAQVIGA